MLGIFTALIVGLITGTIQFYLLFKFVTSITGGKTGSKTLIFAITQFIFPFLVLIACAFLMGDNLMWVGIGIASALIIGAVIKFFLVSKITAKSGTKSKSKSTN